MPLSATDPLVLHVDRLEGELLVFSRGRLVFRRRSTSDGSVRITVPLNPHLDQIAVNQLSFVGIDWDGNARFRFHLELAGEELPGTFVDTRRTLRESHPGNVVAFLGLSFRLES